MRVADGLNFRQMTGEDMDSFQVLVKQVEPLFGPMVGEDGFVSGIMQAIHSGCCTCAVDREGTIAGAVIIERHQNEICWLAVSDDRRGSGMGKALLELAVEQLDSTRPIMVQTFAEGIEAGAPARRLYQANRFVDQNPGGRNPAGYETVWMARPATTE